jgi:hypothetical protein
MPADAVVDRLTNSFSDAFNKVRGTVSTIAASPA